MVWVQGHHGSEEYDSKCTYVYVYYVCMYVCKYVCMYVCMYVQSVCHVTCTDRTLLSIGCYVGSQASAWTKFEDETTEDLEGHVFAPVSLLTSSQHKCGHQRNRNSEGILL